MSFYQSLTEVVGYTHSNGYCLCTKHGWKFGPKPDEGNELGFVQPIFRGDEWDSQPTCDVCLAAYVAHGTPMNEIEVTLIGQDEDEDEESEVESWRHSLFFETHEEARNAETWCFNHTFSEGDEFYVSEDTDSHNWEMRFYTLHKLSEDKQRYLVQETKPITYSLNCNDE